MISAGRFSRIYWQHSGQGGRERGNGPGWGFRRAAAGRPGRFVVLGSASPDLTGLGSESLAGRVALVELSGFRLGDVGVSHLGDLWLRGGLPESFLASDEQASSAWRDDYIATFLIRGTARLAVPRSRSASNRGSRG